MWAVVHNLGLGHPLTSHEDAVEQIRIHSGYYKKKTKIVKMELGDLSVPL